MPPPTHGPALPKPAPAQSIEDYGRECALIGLFNERAAVITELDALARSFDAAGKPNTAKKVRETMEAIDARFREHVPAAFDGPPGAPTT